MRLVINGGTAVPRAVLGTMIVLSAAACATGMGRVSPDEIPALSQELDARPDQPQVRLRYAAALFANGECDAASDAARVAMVGAPSHAAGPLIVGQCLEQAGSHAEAREVYTSYLASFGSEQGAEAVRARDLLVMRVVAEERARAALADEANLATPNPTTTGVLPFDVGGDEALGALRLGVAWMVSTDLAMIERFQMVERVQMNALLEELSLSDQGLTDPATALRAGRLMGAGRLIQGVLAGSRDEDAALTASVLASDGQVLRAEPRTGPFRDLLTLEKSLVLDLANQMGYVLTESERNLILENGTQNLIAFLAFSDGLLAEDRGDYTLAAQHYAEAARQDPGFSEARTRMQASLGADDFESSGPTDVTQIASTLGPSARGSGTLNSSAGNALINSISDIGALQGETATGSGTGDGGKQIDQLTHPATIPPSTLPATIRIQIRIPNSN